MDLVVLLSDEGLLNHPVNVHGGGTLPWRKADNLRAISASEKILQPVACPPFKTRWLQYS